MLCAEAPSEAEGAREALHLACGLAREKSRSLPVGWGLAERGRDKASLRWGKRGQWKGKDKLPPPGNTPYPPSTEQKGAGMAASQRALERESGGGFPARPAGLRQGVGGTWATSPRPGCLICHLKGK